LILAAHGRAGVIGSFSSDGRLGTHVIRVMLNQAAINEAQEAAQAAAAAQAALQAAAAAQAAPQGEGQAAE
jgi:hypothetical protein